MKKILCILAILFVTEAGAQAPNWLWSHSIGGTSTDRCESIVTDSSGNLYATGYFRGTTDFDPGPGVFNLTSGVYDDIFVAKYDPMGNMLWTRSMGSFFWDKGHSLILDPAGGAVYIAGEFKGTVDFDPGPGIFNLVSTGPYDAFICKLDTAGNLIWVKDLGGTGETYSYGIDADASGNIYATGNFYQTTDFDPGAGIFNLTAAGADDIFVCKLDSGGSFQWARSMGGTANDRGYSISVESSGNGDVYVTGFFRDTVDFDPGAGVVQLISSGFNDLFIAKLDSMGNLAWAKGIGGVNDDYGQCIAVAPDGLGSDVYTTGSYDGTVDFDPGPGTFNLTSVSNSDVYVSKLDSAGNFVWTKSMGGSFVDVGFSIAVEALGNGALYTTGYFSNTSDFDPGPAISNLVSAGQTDVFVSKLDTAGNFIWAKSAGGLNTDIGVSLALVSGTAYVTGFFESPSIVLGSDTLFNDTTNVTSDIFQAKIDHLPTGIENVIAPYPVSVYPNPASDRFTIAAEWKPGAVVRITDLSGKTIAVIAAPDSRMQDGQQIVMNTQEFANGVYMISIQTPDSILIRKLVIAR